MTQGSPAEIIIEALILTRERVTADTIEARQARKDKLKDAISRMQLHQDTGAGGPSASELRDLLDDPDDSVLRHALEAWKA